MDAHNTFYALQYRDTGEYLTKHSVLSTRTTHIGKARIFPSRGIAKMTVPMVGQWFENRGLETPSIDVVALCAYPANDTLLIEVENGKVTVDGTMPYEVEYTTVSDGSTILAIPTLITETDRFYEE